LPSSAWALIVVNQFFAGAAIVVQAAMFVALCVGKGSRIVIQILNGVAVIALLISVVSIMNIPARLFEVCLRPLLGQLSSNSLAVSYTFDVGGERQRAASSFILPKSTMLPL
jgi:hypothetical protein